jgi:hypothetical protein
MTYWFWKFRVYVSIDEGKGQAGPETPSTIQDIDSPENPYRCVALFRNAERFHQGTSPVKAKY